MQIIIGCSKDDEVVALCQDYFGKENVVVVPRRGMLSVDEIALIISIVSLTIETASFIYEILSSRDKSDDQNKESQECKRCLITKDGDLYLEGYSKEEVTTILNSLND